jgi:hypothetical protein
MNQLLEPQTPLDVKRAAIREETEKSLVAAYHLIKSMKYGFDRFWDGSPELMLELLNGNVAHWLKVFAANKATGTLLNAQVEGDSERPERVPLDMPAGYDFDETTFLFTYTEAALPES